MSLWSGFRKFLARGNILELAIGIIIGTAFNHIVTSLVNDIIMPPIGLILNHVNFDNLYLNLSRQHFPSLSAAKAAGAPTVNYGAFINQVLDFFIIALVVYFILEQFDRSKTEDTTVVTTKSCPFCTREIPLQAKRCPECTADLTAPPGSDG